MARFVRSCIRVGRLAATSLTIASLLTSSAQAATLKPETVSAFNYYVRLTEARMDAEINNGDFLILDSLPADRRASTYVSVRGGAVYIEPLHTLDNGDRIRIPSGMIHHWAGVAFIPGANLAQSVAVMQDYDDQAKCYAPDVQVSKLLAHNGDNFKIVLRIYNKSLITVVFDAKFDIYNTALDDARIDSRSRSTRVSEVANPGKSNEHELPVGNDHGYMWRLYSYWRLEEKDGGTYVQIETIELSRSVPPEFEWFVGPLIESIPRRTLTKLLTATRLAVLNQINPK